MAATGKIAQIAKDRGVTEQVIIDEIRAKRAAGVTTHLLAVEYGVYPGTIRHYILTGHIKVAER